MLRILEVTGPSSCCEVMVELLKRRFKESDDEVVAVRWAIKEMRDLDAERDRDESIGE